jgi:hypothetical protein
MRSRNSGVERIALALVLCLCAAGPSFAQRTTYNANRPTLSPWFGLFQKNSGPLPNYHTFVRPEQDALANSGAQSAQIQQQGDRLRIMGQQMNEFQQPGGESGLKPTGKKATYMDYSHYYTYNGKNTKPISGGRNWAPKAGRSGGAGAGGGGGF